MCLDNADDVRCAIPGHPPGTGGEAGSRPERALRRGGPLLHRVPPPPG